MRTRTLILATLLLAWTGVGHMHNARIRFVDPDHVTASWDFYEGGRLKTTETFEYSRVR